MKLSELSVGRCATIRAVGGTGALRRHLLDMGLTPGTAVTLRKTAPMGDPVELELRGYELTLRLADAENIEIADERAPAPPARPPFRTEPRWCLPLQATRTAAKPPCSISSPVPTSTWATSPA